jgi:hypothetical protein
MTADSGSLIQLSSYPLKIARLFDFAPLLIRLKSFMYIRDLSNIGGGFKLEAVSMAS